MAETWTPDIPVVSHDVTDDVVLIEKNFDYLAHRFGYLADTTSGKDHAVATGTNVKQLCTDIGTTKKATIFFAHLLKDQNTTDFVFGTGGDSCDLSTYTNITFAFQPGARVSVVTGKTVTFPSPENIQASKVHQIFTGAGTVAFNSAGTIYPQWWGANNNDTSDDNTAMAAAVASYIAGSKIFLRGGSQYYSISAALAISKDVTIEGEGESSEIRQATTQTEGLEITTSNVTLKGINLVGPSYLATKSGEDAIKAYGADSSNYISKLKVYDCFISNWGAYGVYGNFVEDFEIHNNEIENIYYAGIQGLSCRQGTVEHKKISSDISVAHNTIRNIPKWKACDTHAGERISFVDNKIEGCFRGIGAGPASDGSDYMWAPIDCHILGNEMDSGVADGTYGLGASIIGAYSGAAIQEVATGIIAGNTIRGYGDEDYATNGAVHVETTQGVVVNGNTIINAGRCGVYVYARNQGVVVISNAIVDPWTDGLALGYGVFVDTIDNTGYIGGNTFSLDALVGVKTHVLDEAIRVDNSAGCEFVLGLNHSEATTYLTDAGTKTTCTNYTITNKSADRALNCNLCVITDPGDAPATADALRDDLVANTIPSIEADVNELADVVGTLIDDLIAMGLLQ